MTRHLPARQPWLEMTARLSRFVDLSRLRLRLLFRDKSKVLIGHRFSTWEGRKAPSRPRTHSQPFRDRDRVVLCLPDGAEAVDHISLGCLRLARSIKQSHPLTPPSLWKSLERVREMRRLFSVFLHSFLLPFSGRWAVWSTIMRVICYACLLTAC